jgi:hypothetical protein
MLDLFLYNIIMLNSVVINNIFILNYFTFTKSGLFMKKTRLLFVLLACAITTQVFGMNRTRRMKKACNLKRVTTYETLKKKIEEALVDENGKEKKNVLVVWDVDNVILNQYPEYYVTDNLRRLLRGHKNVYDEYIKKVSPDIVLPLLDKEIVQFIKELQKNKNVKTICLTAHRIGPYGDNTEIENERIERLKSYGLDFSNAFDKYPDYMLFEINEFDEKEFCVKLYEENLAKSLIEDLSQMMYGQFNMDEFFLYKSGILFTNHIYGEYGKSIVLEAFLHNLREKTGDRDEKGWEPETIVVVDDKEENLMPHMAEMIKRITPQTDYLPILDMRAWSKSIMRKEKSYEKNVLKEILRKYPLPEAFSPYSPSYPQDRSKQPCSQELNSSSNHKQNQKVPVSTQA